MGMFFSCHQLRGAFSSSFRLPTGHKCAMVQKEPQQLQIVRTEVLSEEKVVSSRENLGFQLMNWLLGLISLPLPPLTSLAGTFLKVACRGDSTSASKG